MGPLVDNYSPENTAYDTVADPEAFRFHQLYLGWAGYDTKARVGAQEILLDNQRFIGNVGWRFNAQSFNAGLIQNESIDNLKLFYAYTDSINEPNGENNPDRQYHLLNGEYKLGDNNKLSAYAIGGLTVASLLSFIMPRYKETLQIQPDDPRVESEYITYKSPKGGA